MAPAGTWHRQTRGTDRHVARIERTGVQRQSVTTVEAVSSVVESAGQSVHSALCAPHTDNQTEPK